MQRQFASKPAFARLAFLPRLRIANTLVMCLLSLLLAGCSPPAGQALLEDYLYRLGNASQTDIDQDLNTLPPVMAYPPRRQRLAPVTELREGLLDTLNLGACNLLPLVAERNSSLGRVMPVSQTLMYELRFYSRLHDCRLRPEIISNNELHEQLEEIFRVKQRNLSAVVWNAIYNSKEMEAAFALGATPLSPDEQSTLTPVLQSLQRLAQLNTLSRQAPPWQPPAYLASLESDYEVLHRNHFGAQWLSSIRLLTETLQRAAQALETRLNGRALCPQGRPTPQAKILHNVFQKYYAGQVQPYMATIHRSGAQWLQQHEQLLAALIERQRLASYEAAVLSREGALWQSYIRARDRHTQAWQTQLRQCGLMPGSRL
ncbi:MAG: DUF3080 domain-containing protein [Marinobacterium sp.]|nr:DUF3080 domain-containing protein [Marinobacterium sp.]